MNRRPGATGLAKRPCGSCKKKSCKKAKWRAWYADQTGKEHTRHFARKVDGQNWLDENTAHLIAGTWVDPRAGKILVCDYAEQWMASRVVRESTLRNVDVALRVHLIPALGQRPMHSILRSDIQALIKRIEAKERAPSTIRRIYEIVRGMFIAAVDDEVISVARMPCKRIELPAGEQIEIVPPTTERVTELVDAVPARLRAAVLLLAGTGLRIGEMLGLQIGDVDFLRREVHVRRQRLQRGKKTAPPKTRKSYRTVPLSPVMVETLAAHVAAHRGGPQAEPTDWLFATKAGEGLSYSSWLDVWKAAQRPDLEVRRTPACPMCGAESGARCVRLTGKHIGARALYDHDERSDVARGRAAVDTHGLRHYFVSCLIASGASVKLVSETVGHSSPRITLDVYAHLWPGDDDVVRDAIEAALGGLRAAVAS